MKKLLKYSAFLIVLSFFLACERETIAPDECYVSPEIDDQYRTDVYRLLFREIYYDSTHPDRYSPKFNESRTRELLQAFQAVSDLNLPVRDTVMDEYNIHVFPFFGLHSISLSVDPSALEIQRLVDGQPTGNTDLDYILNTYAFNEVRTSLYYPEFNWITITSEHAWNLIPIWESLKTFDFIYDAGMGDYAIGDGNTIVLERNNSSLVLDFSIGWGDCPSGCLYRKHWIFKVSETCQVTYTK